LVYRCKIPYPYDDEQIKIDIGSDSNIADVRFLKPEVVITQPQIEISHPKFGVKINFNFSKRTPTLKTKPEIDFRLYGHRIEQSI